MSEAERRQDPVIRNERRSHRSDSGLVNKSGHGSGSRCGCGGKHGKQRELLLEPSCEQLGRWQPKGKVWRSGKFVAYRPR